MLASTLSKTEIMVLNFYQQGHLSQRMGQSLMNMMRHPQFRVEELQSATIVQLLWHRWRCTPLAPGAGMSSSGLSVASWRVGPVLAEQVRPASVALMPATRGG